MEFTFLQERGKWHYILLTQATITSPGFQKSEVVQLKCHTCSDFVPGSSKPWSASQPCFYNSPLAVVRDEPAMSLSGCAQPYSLHFVGNRVEDSTYVQSVCLPLRYGPTYFSYKPRNAGFFFNIFAKTQRRKKLNFCPIWKPSKKMPVLLYWNARS